MPWTGTIEVTPFCNLKCAHCYISQCHWEGDILSCHELCRILDEAAAEGCLWLLLTGGEPLLRDDFLDIYAHAKRKGMIITIFTNGTLVTPDIARYFHDWSPHLVEISIYGATRSTHEEITGVAGSFERCLKGIELLVKQGIRVTLKTMVMTQNKHEIWEMKKLAKDFGIPFRFDAVINPALDGSRYPCALRLSPEEVVRLDAEDPEYYEAWVKSCQAFLKIPEPRDTLFTCGAGMASFHIDAFGRLQMCTIAREPSYDLRRGSFCQGWRDFLPAILSQKEASPSSCRSCQYRPVCLICPGWGQLEYGTPQEKPIDYLCQIARLRARAFGLEGEIADKATYANKNALSRPLG
jgi:radical SAM protein with 4Fe4S-binding SPASM domain